MILFKFLSGLLLGFISGIVFCVGFISGIGFMNHEDRQGS